MARVLILTRDRDQRSEICRLLADEPEFDEVEIKAFSDRSSLESDLDRQEEVLLVMINYDPDCRIDGAGVGKTNESIVLAESLSTSKGPPVLFIGPVDRFADAQVISLLEGVETIDASYMFNLNTEADKPFFVVKMLAMIDGSRVREDETDKPTGLIELAIDEKDTVHCVTTLLYRDGRFHNFFARDFPYDSNMKWQLSHLTKVLSSVDDPGVFFDSYQWVGGLTRDILNYDEKTKRAILKLVHLAGDVSNVWIRFRVPYREMAHIPFEAVLRCDHFEERGLPEFQLKYSPVYRVVGDPISSGSAPRFPKLSGLHECCPDRISCLIIDATTSGPVEKNGDPGLPDALPDISGNAEKEIELVTEVFGRIEESGGISKLGKIDFASDAEKEDPAEALDAIVKSGDWDIIHFSGHSIYQVGEGQMADAGYLFLPGKNRAIPVSIMDVADWFSSANLVYMSSCQSAEPAFVNALADRGIPTIIGFRWQISSYGATQFAGLFYHYLFRERTGDIEFAFVEAQRCLMDPRNYPRPRELVGNGIWSKTDWKAWASPMLVMQNV